MKGARSSMDPLLFVCHRLPFPPNKGDKVRSYHFLRHLAERYRIFLGTFVDDPADWEHVKAVKALCAEIHVEALHPRIRRLASASGLLTGEALTLPYFRSRVLHDWVRKTALREEITQAFAFSSPMVQYLLDVPGLRCVADFVDVDSVKWDDYARRRSWPASALYTREAHRLLAYERHVAVSVDAIVFVTGEETRLFKERVPERACRIATIRNGVNGDYFAPSPDVESPFVPGERPIVFTGAMDYWPNVDAVLWFAREVLPVIRRQEPRARFHVVGMNPAPVLRSLTSDPAIAVTGRVADIRPYLQHAQVVVAPLRVARGIQNKVLEAMAMAKPVVVTPAIANSLSARRGVEVEVAAEAKDFATRVVDLFDLPRANRMGALARERALSDYAWPASLQLLDELLGDEAPAPLCRIASAIDAPISLAAE